MIYRIAQAHDAREGTDVDTSEATVVALLTGPDTLDEAWWAAKQAEFDAVAHVAPEDAAEGFAASPTPP